jgi:hypothetical protein
MQKHANVADEANVAEAPRMEIQTWNIERFIPYARNPRMNDAARHPPNRAANALFVPGVSSEEMWRRWPRGVDR